MDRLLNKDDVRAQLEDRKDTIQRRIDALEDEVSTSGEAVREAVLGNPLVMAGGAIAAGLLVGLLFGGRRGRRTGPDAHRALVDAYIQAVANDARRFVRRGRNTEDAVREALQDRVPLVVYEAAEQRQGGGLLFGVADFALKTAVGFAVKAGIDFLAQRIELDELVLPDDEANAPASGGDGLG